MASANDARGLSKALEQIGAASISGTSKKRAVNALMCAQPLRGAGSDSDASTGGEGPPLQGLCDYVEGVHQKLVVCGLKLAQGQMMSDQGRGRCTYLIDDLPSELDEGHSKLVCALLASMGAQVFITCVNPDEIRAVWPSTQEIDLFHVEQGKVHRQPGA